MSADTITTEAFSALTLEAAEAKRRAEYADKQVKQITSLREKKWAAYNDLAAKLATAQTALEQALAKGRPGTVPAKKA